MNLKLKQVSTKYIIEAGYSIYNNDKTSNEIKAEVIKQLKWLNDYLNEDEDLLELKNDFSNNIENLEYPAHNT